MFFHEKENLRAKKITPKFNWIMAHFAVTMEIWPSPLGLRAPKIHPWNPHKKRTQIWKSFGFQLLSCWRIQNFIFHSSLFFFRWKCITLVRKNPSCTHVYHAQRRPFQLRECLARLVRRRFHWDENFNTENVRNKKDLQKQSKSPCFFLSKIEMGLKENRCCTALFEKNNDQPVIFSKMSASMIFSIAFSIAFRKASNPQLPKRHVGSRLQRNDFPPTVLGPNVAHPKVGGKAIVDLSGKGNRKAISISKVDNLEKKQNIWGFNIQHL